ncbi:MAG TPA: hypothetical protein ENJ79_00525 [Gammaproteobacteria bacterium]|nr:hypothetical protein [Gammaproteobacteria bacterium]
MVTRNKEDAMLGIVDLDGSSDAWNNFRQQYPALPAIALSESPHAIENALHVAKPARLDALWSAIVSLVKELPAPDSHAEEACAAEANSAAHASPDGKKTVPVTGATADAMNSRLETAGAGAKTVLRAGSTGTATPFYHPEEYLLGYILSTLKNRADHQRAIHIQCWKDRQLVLYPDKGRVFTDLTDSQLKNLGVITSRGFRHEIKPWSGTPAGLQSRSIEHLLWDLALRTARGRVPAGTDLSRPTYLQYWPNFPRLPHTPHGMRIAALWAGRPRTLDSIATDLGIEPAHVYSFYSAAAAIGLAGQDEPRTGQAAPPEDVKKKRASPRGLLASILRRIGKPESRA